MVKYLRLILMMKTPFFAFQVIFVIGDRDFNTSIIKKKMGKYIKVLKN